MTPWLTLVIGVILGLLLGWLIDMFWRRRPVATPPADDVTAHTRKLEGAVLQPAPWPSEEPAEAAVLTEVEHVGWPELSDRVAQVADEVVAEPARIDSVLPEAPEGLPADAIDALAPATAERAGAPASDDLLRIEGIGPVYDGRLRAAGINTFVELMNAGEARLQEIIRPQAWQRIEFGEWIEQARLIVEGNEEELRLLQGRLFSRKKG